MKMNELFYFPNALNHFGNLASVVDDCADDLNAFAFGFRCICDVVADIGLFELSYELFVDSFKPLQI